MIVVPPGSSDIRVAKESDLLDKSIPETKTKRSSTRNTMLDIRVFLLHCAFAFNHLGFSTGSAPSGSTAMTSEPMVVAYVKPTRACHSSIQTPTNMHHWLIWIHQSTCSLVSLSVRVVSSEQIETFLSFLSDRC
jgi:hypothetical protein